MNRDYEIIRLKLEDAHQPVRYFTPEFYEAYIKYRKETGNVFPGSVADTDFFLQTPSAFSEFVQIYNERLPKWCIDYKEKPSDRRILKRMVEKFEDAETAERYARRWTMYFGKYYEISKVA